MEGRSARNCRRNGVNPAISAKGKTPDKKLNNYYYYYTAASKGFGQTSIFEKNNSPSNLMSLNKLPARWRSGWRVRFAVGRPGVHSPKSIHTGPRPRSLPVVVTQFDERHANRA